MNPIDPTNPQPESPWGQQPPPSRQGESDDGGGVGEFLGEAAGVLGETAGGVIEGAAKGCAGCGSCSLVVLVVLCLTAGAALAVFK